MGQLFGFTEDGAERVVRATRRVLGEPFPSQVKARQRPDAVAGRTFIIASDPGEYDEPEGDLPLGYRGHVIGYILPEEFDIANLPEVPSLDTLIQNASRSGETKGVERWASHPWVADYENETLGRPVLINVCRFSQGLFFRGQVVQCEYVPGFRYSGVYRGEHFGYAAPTWGEWPEGNSASTEYDQSPGWCCVSGGWTGGLVRLTSHLESGTKDVPEFGYATGEALAIEHGTTAKPKTLGMDNPASTEQETIPELYVYSTADTFGSLVQARWNHNLFRLESGESLKFKNTHSEPVPAFSILRITAVTESEAEGQYLEIAQPNTYGSQYMHAINGPIQIKNGEYGRCVMPVKPCMVSYNDADGTPALGEKWGPRDASWKLRKNTGGFQILGAPDTATTTVLAVRAPMLSFIGKTDASHAKSATGTISIWAGTLGSETDTTVNMTGVYNRFAAVGTPKWVRCDWNHDGSAWELVAAEC